MFQHFLYSDISRAYTDLNSSAKIDECLRLAQGIEEGVVIQVPSDYKLPENTNNFVNTIKGLEFEQRVDFTRSIVMEMGAK
ncbi:orange carotenoid protein N-terminal domain-containing protein [Fischerella thermalis]|uniref:orange carotenoid protein N-terminal domain-containing protein n=1 Tax=Fischerella thermalis TaxID=372787 RepID=UPI0021558F00|nr:orange carotenoid protein N-terminal domain-containing protein [Fischerella thermalis]